MAWSLVLAALALTAGSGGVPANFPELDMDALTYTLAVVDVEENGSLPERPVCKTRKVWCFHEPSWFRGTVRSVVAGAPLPEHFHASTTSHYGLVELTDDPDQPRLMLLASQGDDLVMIRYAEDMLYTDSRGRLHLPLWNTDDRWWLPCSSDTVAEPVVDRTLMMTMASPMERGARRAKDDRIHQTEGRAYWPRRTIPLDALQKHLANAPAVRSDFACLADGVSDPQYSFFMIVSFEDEEGSSAEAK